MANVVSHIMFPSGYVPMGHFDKLSEAMSSASRLAEVSSLVVVVVAASKVDQRRFNGIAK